MEEIKFHLHLLNENVKQVNKRLNILDRNMIEESKAMERYITQTDKKIANNFQTMDRKFATMDRKFADIDSRFAAIKLSSHISKNISAGSMYEVGRYFREMDQRVLSIEHLASNDQDIPPSRGEQPLQDNPCYAQETGGAIELGELVNEAAQRGLFIFINIFTGFEEILTTILQTS